MIALIPIPPMPSPRPRVTQRGTYMPTAYRRHVDALALALRTQCRTHHSAGVPLWVEIEVRLARPKSAPKSRTYPCVRPDVDNYAKTMLDAATHAGLWADDGQVVSLRTLKVYGTPGYHIRVEALPNCRTERRAPIHARVGGGSMNAIEMHHLAMEHADLAHSLRRFGRTESALERYTEALDLERQAIALLPPTAHTSRVIMLSSACAIQEAIQEAINELREDT